jgi:hypothetical protein
MDERRSVGDTPLDRRRVQQLGAAAAATPVVVGGLAERARGTSPAITVSTPPDPMEVTR